VKSKFIKNADNFDLQDMEVEEIGQEAPLQEESEEEQPAAQTIDKNEIEK